LIGEAEEVDGPKEQGSAHPDPEKDHGEVGKAWEGHVSR
jgi:hypothetical protein